MKLALFDLDDTLLAGDSDALGAVPHRARRDRRDDYERRNDVFFQHYRRGSSTSGSTSPSSSPPSPAARASRSTSGTAISWRRRSVPSSTRSRRPSSPRTPARSWRSSRRPAASHGAHRPRTGGGAPHRHGSGGVARRALHRPPRGHAVLPRGQGRPDARMARLARPASRGFLRDLVLPDSHNDLPLLELVSMPVAVDPDPTLESHARERGWPILRLRA